MGKSLLEEGIFGSSSFDEQIDMPLVSKQFLDSKDHDDLNALLIPLYGEDMSIRGIFRVYSAMTITEDIQLSLEEVAERIGLFFERI